MHYLDNAATTKPHADVVAEMGAVLSEQWANPSSLYAPGMASEQCLAKSREVILKAMGAPQGATLLFTGSGTEADNLAILGAARFRKKWGNHLVAPAYEHPGVHNTLLHLAEKEGFRLTLVPPSEAGAVSEDALLQAVSDKTVLLCAMHLNNETGAVLNTARLAKRAKEKNKRLAVHVDAVQAFCKLDLGLQEGMIDSCAISAHKLHGPKGIGALYIRKGFATEAVLFGGGQENGLRPGTENIAAAAAFAKAVQLAMASRHETANTIEQLRQQLQQGLEKLPGVCLNSPKDGWAGICNFSVPPLRSEVMLHHLEAKGVYVSAGSACAKGQQSHTLSAMQLPKQRIESALRVSFCGQNSEADVVALLNGLQDGFEKLAK